MSLEWEATIKALICGGRNVGRTNPNSLHSRAADEIRKATAVRKFVSEVMDELHVEKVFSEIVAGNEGGAERLGVSWATVNRIPCKIFDRKGPKESTIQRNMRMLRESQPAMVVAFGGGESTTALLEEAKRHGVTCVEIAVPEF